MTTPTPDNAALAPEDFHDRLYGLTFKLFLNPSEDTPNNEVRLVLGATVGSGDSEVAYFHAVQGVLHDAATVTALEAEVSRLTEALTVVKHAMDARAVVCKRPLVTKVKGDYVTQSVHDFVTRSLTGAGAK